MKNLLIVLLCLISTSCKDSKVESLFIESASLFSKESVDPDIGEMEMGPRLPNPYEIKNMRKALEALQIKTSKFKDLILTPNYNYVRFLPNNKAEYDIINSTKTFDIFEYPLDRKIIKKGNKYTDPSIRNYDFGWMYAAIPSDYKPDFKIKMELLDELFLPEGNGKTDAYQKDLQSKDLSYQSFMQALEEESLKIYGDGKYNSTKNDKTAKVQEWYSSGRIRVQDERLSFNESSNTYTQGVAGWVPVPGCLVRANRWFTTKTALTNVDGTFSINHGWPNGSAVDMDIKWDRDDFDIRTGSYGQAITSNQNIVGPWHPNITEAISPDHYIYAHVHRAAWKYYYNNTFGVISPPSANFGSLGGKIHLGAKQGGGRPHYFQFNGTWLASDVKLPFDLLDHDARYIFGTTIHELTHAAHWAIGMNYTAYCANSGQAGRLAESWATAVGWHAARDIYGVATDPSEDFDDYQRTTLSTFGGFASCASNDPWYTPLFIDLIDTYNQNTYHSSLPVDQANGYNITTLQSFLVQKPTNWYYYRDYLEANSSNPTEPSALQLFSDYD